MTKGLVFPSWLFGRGLTRSMAMLLVAFAYVAWPIAPLGNVPKDELREVVGTALFRDILTSRMSDTYFFVGDLRLNCSLGPVGGRNGCTYFRNDVAKGIPVKANYYHIRTRIGLSYPVLHSLSQGNKEIVSDRQAYEFLMLSYHSLLSSYRQLFGLLVLVLIAAVFIDRANARRNDNASTREQ